MRGAWWVSGLIELRFLGGLDVSRDGQPVGGFVSSKAPALIAFLAVTAEAHSREYLAGLLWGDVPEKDARASLRVVLSNLRQTLGPEQFEITRSHVKLAGDADLVSDVVEMSQIVDSMEEEGLQDYRDLSRIAEIYRGDFLSGFIVRDAPDFDEWVIAERERLRAQAATAFEMLADVQAGAGEHAAAASTLERLLALDPWHEIAFRRYLTQLALAGRRAAALVQFDAFTQMLERELDIGPEPETIDLYEQIRDGRIAASDGIAQGPDVDRTEPMPRGPTLARPSTSFVGRQEELARIARHLEDPAIRLITLIGPGGSGKTRLALKAFGEYGHNYELGGFVVFLAGIDRADQILPALAEAMKINLDTGGDLVGQIRRQIAGSSVLLLFDNFEHLIDGAKLIGDLLEALPSATLLVTSRERLALQSEWVLPLRGLALPGDEDIDLLHSSAVRLFVDRARQVRPDFLPEPGELRDIARICHSVEGLPLGIELAAGWMRLMDPAEIGCQIRESLDFLSTTLRDVPDRHRSLRAVFEGSWNLLDASSQERLRSLSVFSGGFTVEAARATAGAELPDLLDFTDKSLVRRDPSGRFELHELLRQYAGEHLADDPEAAMATKDRLAGYYAELMAMVGPQLTGPRQALTLQEIAAERSNLRNAWEWMVSRRQFELMGKSLNGVALYYAIHQQPASGRQMMDIAEAALRAESDGCPAVEVLLGRVLGRQARFSLMSGRTDLAEAQIAEGYSLLAQHQAEDQLAYGLDIKGRIASLRGDFQEAQRLHQRALEEAQRTGDSYGVSTALNRLGGIAFDIGDYRAARDGFSRSLEVRRASQDWEGVARDLGNLGEVDCETGDYERALSYMEESLAVYRELGVDRLPSRLEGMGRVALRLGNLDEAECNLMRAEQIDRERGGRGVGSIAMLRRAEVAVLRGDLAGSKQLLARSRESFEAQEFRPGIVQWRVVRARLALAGDLPQEAIEHAGEAVALAEELHSAIGRALALGAMARAMAALGRTDEALAVFRRAIRTVEGSGAVPAMLDLAAGMTLARLAQLDDPDVAADATDVAELSATLFFVQAQPQSWYSTRAEIETAITMLESSLDRAAVSAARQRAETLSIESILRELLGRVASL